MAKKKTTYSCIECERSLLVGEEEEVPDCCGAKMKPLSQCTTADHAEMARNEDESDACDDNRE